MEHYFEHNGTWYNNGTPLKLIEVLEKIKKERIRVVFDFGYTETKTSWNEVYDTTGYIGRSTGTKPIII